jgi:hypothetical protein
VPSVASLFARSRVRAAERTLLLADVLCARVRQSGPLPPVAGVWAISYRAIGTDRNGPCRQRTAAGTPDRLLGESGLCHAGEDDRSLVRPRIVADRPERVGRKRVCRERRSNRIRNVERQVWLLEPPAWIIDTPE